MITGALILLIGLVIGYILGRIQRRPKGILGPSKEPQAICGCSHHYSFHNDDGCNFNYGYWEYGQYRSRPCACKKYSGPEPLPLYLPGPT